MEPLQSLCRLSGSTISKYLLLLNLSTLKPARANGITSLPPLAPTLFDTKGIVPMKQHRRSRRSGSHSNNQNGNVAKSSKGKRSASSNQANGLPQYADEVYESAVAPQSPAELEAYLATQMRRLIHARQEQERALRQIRALGEQLAQEGAPPQVQEQYAQALALWQSSRRNGVSARQKLLFAMSEKLMIDTNQP